MKFRRIMLACIMLALLAGALAWEFWPGEKPVAAAPEKSVPPTAVKMASAPADTPSPATTPTRIAMPVVPAVVPAKSSMEAQDTSTNSPDDATAFNDAQTRAIAAKQTAMQQAMKGGDPQAVAWVASLPTDMVETDWGEIQVVDGVPMELTTSAGDPVTITPTVRSDGTLQLVLNMQQSDGDSTRGMKAMIVAKPGQSVQLGVGNQSFKMTPTL